MTARYFAKTGATHSARGTDARERGAMIWSKLPARLRKGLTTKQADAARISQEWHHAGVNATETTVYYIEQVEAYWAEIENAGLTVEDVKDIDNFRAELREGTLTAERRTIWTTLGEISNAVEEVRERIENEG